MAGREYKPGLTISLLHESKSRYQADMLKAIGLTMILPVALTLYITFFLSAEVGNETVVDASDMIFVRELPFGSESASGASNESNGSSGPRTPDFSPPVYRHHKGFAGFDGYRISKGLISFSSDYSLGSAVPLPDAYTWVAEYPDEVTLFYESEDQLDGLPEAPTFFDFDLPGRLPEAWKIPGHADGQVEILSRDRPLMIKLMRVRYPRKGWHVDGLVKIVLVLNEEGQFKELEIVREEPKGHGFAKAFREALNESLFFPARVNGRNVGIRCEFTYEFCWQCPKEPEIRVTSGNVIITSSQPKSR